MDDYRAQQVEALSVAHEYSGKLLNGIANISVELTGKRLLDTDQYLKELINGLNWIIEVINRTSDVLKEDGVDFHNDEVNAVIRELGDALRSKEDLRIEAALSGGVKDFIQKVEEVTASYANPS